MSNTAIPQLQHILFTRQTNQKNTGETHSSVWQDKSVPLVNRSRSHQAYRGEKAGRSKTDDHETAARHKSDYALVPYTTQLKRFVKTEIQRLAKENKVSESAAGAALLERMIQHNADMQYGALLEPVIRRILQKEIGSPKTLFEWLLLRIAFDANQTRSIATNVLSNTPGIDQKKYKQILFDSSNAAKKNIFGKSPHLAELIGQFNQQIWEGQETSQALR